MNNKNITFKNGTPYLRNGVLVPADNTFKIIQAQTLGLYGPDSDLLSQSDVNNFIIAKLGQLLNTGVSATANTQYYTSTPADLGKYAPYLPANFKVTTSSAVGSGVTQAIADVKALANAQQKALELIAFSAVVPSGSALPSFTGLNANLLSK